MPPVRDASTKPIAATVLPAPVACSNQKRLWAFGSSAAPSATSSSTSSLGASSSQDSSSAGAWASTSASSSSSSSSSSSTARISTSSSSSSTSGSSSTARTGAAPDGAAAPLPFARACALASSATSVPESASTWWGFSSVPSASFGSSSDSTRSSPSSSA